MSESINQLSPAEAQELLAKAQGVGANATKAAAWPAAMVFNGLAMLGSFLMIGLHIVGYTGYGAPLVAISAGAWAAITACTWSFMQSTTKAGFSKRFATSLIVYFVLLVSAIVVGALAFPHGSLAYYIPAAVVLGVVGLAAAIREIRA